jgi:hypothetical protein
MNYSSGGMLFLQTPLQGLRSLDLRGTFGVLRKTYLQTDWARYLRSWFSCTYIGLNWWG